MKRLTREERIALNIKEIERLKRALKSKGGHRPDQYSMLCHEIRSLVGEIERMKDPMNSGAVTRTYYRQSDRL